jgi:8-oxo-dGTP pyrophosphatase MutT (NUDIX family)
MTRSERRNIATRTFDDLWHDLWNADQGRNYQREYTEAKFKFDRLKRGYLLKDDAQPSPLLTHVDIDHLLSQSDTAFEETEWGFPKGRRNINENDFTCAIREFKEETGIPQKNLYVIRNIKPYEEVFSGLNRVRYRHVYFLAMFIDGYDVRVDPSNSTQIREVKSVGWFDYVDAQGKIRDANAERKEVFRRVHQTVQNLKMDACIGTNGSNNTPPWRQHPFFVTPSSRGGSNAAALPPTHDDNQEQQHVDHTES